MKIVDINGFPLVVDDLEKAIVQAENFKDMHHVPPHESDKYRQHYWRDIYEKLLKLKEQVDNTKQQ